MIEPFYEIVKNQLATNEFFKGGFLLSAIASIGLALKSLIPIVWYRLKRRFTYTVQIESRNNLYALFNQWLRQHHTHKYKCVIGSIEWQDSQIQDIAKYELSMKNLDSSFMIWIRQVPVFISTSREKFEGAQDSDAQYVDSYVITSLFSKSVIENLLKSLIEEKNEELTSNKVPMLRVMTSGQYWSEYGTIVVKQLSKIHNSEKILVYNDIKQFLESRTKYEAKGLIWKRGLIFSGPPGNGKTSTALAVANELKLDVHCLNLSNCESDTQLLGLISDIQVKPAMLLVEDIDCSVNGRDQINDKVNFNTVLNVFDGAFSKDGIVVVFTTNHIEKLDPALIRAGRIDMNIEFSNPTAKNFSDMINTMFDRKEDWSEHLTKYDCSKSAVELQNILLQAQTPEDAIAKALTK
jgi:chaperone BCS1